MIIISMFSLSDEEIMLKAKNDPMLFLLVMIFAAVAWPGLAAPDDKIHGKVSGEYTFYSFDLGDTGPPTAKDTKVSIRVSGSFASQLFYHLGREARAKSCVEGNATEIREKGDLTCIRNRTTGKINCALGYDLRKGKSVLGMIC